MTPLKDTGIKGLGERLRAAREGLGFSTRSAVEQLKAQGISISHGTLANYERGLTHPSEEMLRGLSHIYNRSVEWLRGSGYLLEGIRYRALKSVTVREKTQFSNEAVAWLDLYLYLESMLGQPLKPSLTISADDRSISGKELANRVRKVCNLGDHPLPSAIRLLEHFGVRVTQLHTEARIDAFAARFGAARVIVLNADLSADRMRLTSLHELAHHLYEDYLSGASLSNDEIEKRAFEFASHVLIPSNVLKDAFAYKSMVRLVEYKELYGISLAAMVYRGRKERLITQRTYQKIWQQFSRLGFRKDEPGSVAPDRPIRLEALIDFATTNRKMTFSDITSRLSLEESAVRSRVIAAVGGTTHGAHRPSAPNVVSFQTYKDGHDLI
ncbi:helix-turn-helix domain-containing protein [Planctomycetota bacterium]